MLELAELVLRTIHDQTEGLPDKPVDMLSLLRASNPTIPLRLIASEMTALAAEGLLTVRAAHGTSLTRAGLGKVQTILDSAADVPDGHRPYQVKARPAFNEEADDELDLEQIMDLVGSPSNDDLPTDRPTPSLVDDLSLEPSSQAPVPELADDPPSTPSEPVNISGWGEELTKQPEGKSVASTLGELRGLIAGLQESLASASELPVGIWTESVELVKDLEVKTGRLETLLKGRRL